MIEVEEDGRLPFLDMEILHVENCLSSTWYLKPTDTGLIMNFHAVAPRRYKRSVVQSFVHRIHRCCSSRENMFSSLDRAKAILDKNQYPASFYNPIIQKTLEKIEAENLQEQESLPDQNVSTEETTPKYLFKIKYRGTVTDTFVKALYDSKAPVVPVSTIKKIRTFVNTLKAKVPVEITSRVVYQITCPSCHAYYVGQTD